MREMWTLISAILYSATVAECCMPMKPADSVGMISPATPAPTSAPTTVATPAPTMMPMCPDNPLFAEPVEVDDPTANTGTASTAPDGTITITCGAGTKICNYFTSNYVLFGATGSMNTIQCGPATNYKWFYNGKDYDVLISAMTMMGGRATCAADCIFFPG